MRGFSAPGIVIPPNAKMLQIIDALKLRDGLKLCLDAGDTASYSGSGQQWLDVSGNASHFYRGAGSGSEGSDPTFVGPAGNNTAYFSVDGGDNFTLVPANPAWVNNMCGASAAFTLLARIYIAPLAADHSFHIAGTNTGTNGLEWRRHVTNGNPMLATFQQASSYIGVIGSSSSPPENGTWAMCVLSLNKAAGLGLFGYNSTFLPFDTSWTAPASPSTPGKLALMRNHVSGGRIHSFMAWDRALSTAEISNLVKASRKNYGL